MKYGKNMKSFNPNNLDEHNIDRQTLGFIPNKSRVLEIGCATGFMGKYLIEKKKCTVVGVELRSDEAKEAKKLLTKIIEGNIESSLVLKEIAQEEKFDVILASALIQHLVRPFEALSAWRKFLKKDGTLVITCSNIGHWSMRFNIILGKFNYEEYGLLDNTHLHFFTPQTFKDLLKNAGYEIMEYKIDSVGGGYPKISLLGSHIFPNLFTYQMVIKANLKVIKS